jgi:ATP-dependent DNA ligase
LSNRRSHPRTRRSGEQWIQGIKFARYRSGWRIANDTIKVLLRRGHDWTKFFRKIDVFFRSIVIQR